MPDPNRYFFRSTWDVDAPPDVVFDALGDVGEYPRWWPEVKEAVRLDDDHYALRARSILPYDLRFTGARARQDRYQGVLEMSMTGDLEGYSRWTIRSGREGGTELTFEEDVVANKELLRRLARVARPAFKANHALMMRRGRAGLAVYMSGFSRARRPA